MTIGSLIPYTSYAFVVAAQTSLGVGPFSDTVSMRTEETGVLQYGSENELMQLCALSMI